MKETLKLIGIGMILGIGNVIPGVSGGTLAVVFNIYDRLIQVITLNVKKILKEWKFILPLAAGIVAGILLFSTVITYLFEHFPVQTNWFFIGIILGSIPMIYKRLTGAGAMPSKPENTETVSLKGAGNNEKQPRTPVSAYICAVAAFILMVVMTYTDVSETGTAIQTVFSFQLAVRLFIGLALAAIAMIIPGISGSFLMLVLGIYSTIIAAVSSFNIPLLIPAVLGGVTGLLSGAGIVRFLMSRVPSQTYGAILGLVLGSVLVIFPGFGTGWSVLVSLVCAAAGFALSFFASKC